MINAMIIDPKDDVAVAIEPIHSGDQVEYLIEGRSEALIAAQDIPIYHKIAVRDIPEGNPVTKYGEHIGLAAGLIRKGEHVHVHNVTSHREDLDHAQAGMS